MRPDAAAALFDEDAVVDDAQQGLEEEEHDDGDAEGRVVVAVELCVRTCCVSAMRLERALRRAGAYNMHVVGEPGA